MASVFRPRQLGVKERRKLEEAEENLRELAKELTTWLKKAAEAPIGSPERREAHNIVRIYTSERDNAQLQLDKLKREFGQVQGKYLREHS